MSDSVDPKDIIDLIPLDKSTNNLAQEIINETDLKKVQDLTHLFNLNQAKKNVLRILKLNSLLDKVSDQMITRFEKTPDNFSNADLLNYMQVTQSAIDRANKALNLVDESPSITLNQVNVNVGTEALDRESRAKITEAINKILQRSKELEIVPEENINLVQEEVIEVEDETVLNNNQLLNEEEE
jgi:hypothetical protein